MAPPPRPHLPNLGQMSQGLERSTSKMARLASLLRSHLNELTIAAAKQDWVYAHRVSSALARLSRAAGDSETQSAAEAVCFCIERSGDADRVLAAVRRLCLPLASSLESELGETVR